MSLTLRGGHGIEAPIIVLAAFASRFEVSGRKSRNRLVLIRSSRHLQLLAILGASSPDMPQKDVVTYSHGTG